MSGQKWIVRTWTKGDTDFQEDEFDTKKEAYEFSHGSNLNGYESEVREKQPDLFSV